MYLVYEYPTAIFSCSSKCVLFDKCAISARTLTNECEILTTPLNWDVQDKYLLAFLVTHNLEFPISRLVDGTDLLKE